MKKNGVAFIYIILLAMYIFSIWNNIFEYCTDNSSFLELIVSIVTNTVLFVSIFYSNIRFIFISIRKAYLCQKNPTVEWRASTSFYVDLPIDFQSVNNNFIDSLSENNNTIRELKNNDVTLSFKNKGRNNTISYNEKEEYAKIVFKYDFRLAYRESKKEFEKYFIKIVNEYKDALSVNKNVQKQIYELEIKFEKYNPFYRMHVKYYSESEIEDFELKVKTCDGLNIKINNSSMIIISYDEEMIIKASKDYVTISKPKKL